MSYLKLFIFKLKTFIYRRDADGKFMLIGVVSGGGPNGCADKQYPDYFTFIGHNQVSF